MVDYPKDWEEVKLEYILKPQSFKNYICKTAYNVGKHPIIQQGDEPIYGFSNVSAYDNFNNVLLFGDHTLSLYKPVKPFLLSSDGVKILECSKDFIRDYIFYLLKYNLPESEGYKRHYTIIKNMKIPIAINKIEQKAIAETLMTFDRHIENLERLIEKKKMVRDGAIEDLMTGNTRLDRFDDEWEEVEFNDVIVPKARIGWQGLKKDEYLQSGYSYLISGTDFNQGTISFSKISYVTKERYDLDVNIQVNSGDVLVTKDGTIGKVAIVPSIDRKATLNSGVFIFKTNKKLTRNFLYWILRSSIFEKFIDNLSAGSTIKHLYQKDLKNLSFYIPKDMNEQKAISSILKSIDDDIQNLKKEKEKIEKIKAGAMDDLLTGKVRLI
ncbi:restriction endonuclease subunit S [Peptoniphilaceae bacterium SGI.131]